MGGAGQPVHQGFRDGVRVADGGRQPEDRGRIPALENGKILSEMEFADDQVSQASFMMPNSTRVVMLDDPKAVDDTFDNTDNISRRFNGIWESPYEREAKALRRLLGRRGPNGSESSIANQILAQQTHTV